MVEVEKRRKELFDPSKEEWVDEALPTQTVKDRGLVTGAHSGTVAVRKNLGGGTTMRVTFLRVQADFAGKFALVDRGGTFDEPQLFAAGAEVLLGQPDAPVHAVLGSFRVIAGSAASGSMVAAFEGIVPQEGTETI